MTWPLFYWIDGKLTNRNYERDTDLSAVCVQDPALFYQADGKSN